MYENEVHKEEALEKYRCDDSHAKQIYEWIQTRGGILIWQSADLSDPSATITTPYKNAEGEVVTKPGWKWDRTPKRHIVDVNDVEVSVPKEHKRFHVAIRLTGNEMGYKVTDGGSRKIRSEVEKAHTKTGKPAFYVFDYNDYKNAVIMVDDNIVSLVDYINKGEKNV